MPTVIVAGGGLSGLAAAAALGGAGFHVELFEARSFLGGRAASYPLPVAEGPAEVIDNCQHILLRCCRNLLDFYRRLGVEGKIRFHREFTFIEPGGQTSTLRRGALPAPFHFAGSFLKLRFLDFGDKLSIIRGLGALRSERRKRQDLDQVSMLDWLREKRQTPRAIERFWRQILLSAVNEELDRMAAAHGFQVFWLGFLARSDSCEMGVPSIPLGQLYSVDSWERFPNVTIHPSSPVEQIGTAHGRVCALLAGGSRHQADYYVSALPFDRLASVVPELGLDLSRFEHSPITGIHLWFDRTVTELPHAALLDRTIQWMFNKREGRYLQLVVSASRELLRMSRGEVIDLALRELAEFLPWVKSAKLEQAHVVKEARATFSAVPGLEAIRPGAETKFPNLFLAGDWTRSGWPATMEGAVRSGYLAAEAVARAAGQPQRFLCPDAA